MYKDTATQEGGSTWHVQGLVGNSRWLQRQVLGVGRGNDWLFPSWWFRHPSPPPHSRLDETFVIVCLPLHGSPTKTQVFVFTQPPERLYKMLIRSHDSSGSHDWKLIGPFPVPLGSRPNLTWPSLLLWACTSFRAPITKYHKASGLNNWTLLSHCSGGSKSKRSRCLQGWFLLRAQKEGAVPGLSS